MFRAVMAGPSSSSAAAREKPAARLSETDNGRVKVLPNKLYFVYYNPFSCAQNEQLRFPISPPVKVSLSVSLYRGLY